MLVILNVASGPIAVQTTQIKAIVPNADDTACTISFSETHHIEVVGSLAKIRGKLEQRPPAPQASPTPDRPEAAEPEPAADPGEAPVRARPKRAPH